MPRSAVPPAEVRLLLAGVPVAFYPARPEDGRLVLAPRFKPFQTRSVPEVQVRVHLQQPPAGNLGPARFETCAWSYHRLGRQSALAGVLARRSPDRGRYTLWMDNDRPSEVDLYLENPPLTALGALEIPLHPLDEALAVQVLSARRGLLAHACGINLRGRGLVFAGVSGEGKTTLSGLWDGQPGARLLSDERVALRRRAGAFEMHGTCWCSRERSSSTGCVPLERLYVLKHAPSNYTRPLSVLEAVKGLVPRSFLPYWDPEGMAFNLQFLEEVCRAVPCYELGFVPDRSVVAHIIAGIL